MMLFPGLISAVGYKVLNRRKQRFVCPICEYHGPFCDDDAETGITKHTTCPNCGSNARMRLQYLVIQKLSKTLPFSSMSILHFAPEKAFTAWFRKIFRQYDSADIANPSVDYQADLLNLPFKDQSYDVIFASHVLEHIKNDEKALSEIRRVLKPGGIAILPVPIVSVKTIEYAEPNPEECGHVRAPGADYFERYSRHFGKVEIFSSHDFSDKYQTYVYEDRTMWPTKKMPQKQAMQGDRHQDYVPVCHT
jgi:predicted SAM-dependent methyltransferase